MNLLITGGCGHIGSYLAENIYKIKKIKKTFIVDNFKTTQISPLLYTHKKKNLSFNIKELTKKEGWYRRYQILLHHGHHRDPVNIKLQFAPWRYLIYTYGLVYLLYSLIFLNFSTATSPANSISPRSSQIPF